MRSKTKCRKDLQETVAQSIETTDPVFKQMENYIQVNTFSLIVSLSPSRVISSFLTTSHLR